MIGLVTVLVVRLAAYTLSHAASVLGQEGAPTTTPQPADILATSTPATSPQATTTSEICAEDEDTGALNCTDKIVPVGTTELIEPDTEEEDEERGASGAEGDGSCYVDDYGATVCREQFQVSSRVTNLQVSQSGSITLVGRYLNFSDNYKMRLTRISGSSIGVTSNCLYTRRTANVPTPIRSNESHFSGLRT